MISHKEIIIRLILSAITGGLIGVEREVNNRPAGLRTHILVSVGSALMMLVSIDGFYDVETGLRTADSARLAAQVVSGIGFLGAGTIIKTGSNIKGLTTAASLWACACVGLAIGNGYYLGGLLTSVIILFTLMSLRSIEKRIFKGKYKKLEIISINRPGLIGEIGMLLGKHDIIIKDINIVDGEIEDREEHGTMEIHFMVKVRKNFNPNNFFREIYKIEGIFEALFYGRKIHDNNFQVL
ncbi:MgtC/SapB family protein [Anaerosalibacter massiliensis]|uniref:MgtC/SapB family protein n=1 Tax=Anaerosalibacter massiliensis TaxID=1347392 RepID=A0A9X2MKG3_9FIRM|nr:MgtC/SapB family protein [Anaerosalibacter massiliensis]MCR2045384.1 MgtC/SapB family protein [Anaerosalibacter massiliensis]